MADQTPQPGPADPPAPLSDAEVVLAAMREAAANEKEALAAAQQLFDSWRASFERCAKILVGEAGPGGASGAGPAPAPG